MGAQVKDFMKKFLLCLDCGSISGCKCAGVQRTCTIDCDQRQWTSCVDLMNGSNSAAEGRCFMCQHMGVNKNAPSIANV